MERLRPALTCRPLLHLVPSKYTGLVNAFEFGVRRSNASKDVVALWSAARFVLVRISSNGEGGGSRAPTQDSDATAETLTTVKGRDLGSFVALEWFMNVRQCVVAMAVSPDLSSLICVTGNRIVYVILLEALFEESTISRYATDAPAYFSVDGLRDGGPIAQPRWYPRTVYLEKRQKGGSAESGLESEGAEDTGIGQVSSVILTPDIGQPTTCVSWQALDGRDMLILGSTRGVVLWVDLRKMEEVHRFFVYGRREVLSLRIVESSSSRGRERHLLVQSQGRNVVRLVLERSSLGLMSTGNSKGGQDKPAAKNEGQIAQSVSSPASHYDSCSNTSPEMLETIVDNPRGPLFEPIEMPQLTPNMDLYVLCNGLDASSPGMDSPKISSQTDFPTSRIAAFDKLRKRLLIFDALDWTLKGEMMLRTTVDRTIHIDSHFLVVTDNVDKSKSMWISLRGLSGAQSLTGSSDPPSLGPEIQELIMNGGNKIGGLLPFAFVQSQTCSRMLDSLSQKQGEGSGEARGDTDHRPNWLLWTSSGLYTCESPWTQEDIKVGLLRKQLAVTDAIRLAAPIHLDIEGLLQEVAETICSSAAPPPDPLSASFQSSMDAEATSTPAGVGQAEPGYALQLFSMSNTPATKMIREVMNAGGTRVAAEKALKLLDNPTSRQREADKAELTHLFVECAASVVADEDLSLLRTLGLLDSEDSRSSKEEEADTGSEDIHNKLREVLQGSKDYHADVVLRLLLDQGLVEEALIVGRSRKLVERVLCDMQNRGTLLRDGAVRYLIRHNLAPVLCQPNLRTLLRLIRQEMQLDVLLAFPEGLSANYDWITRALPLLPRKSCVRLADALDPRGTVQKVKLSRAKLLEEKSFSEQDITEDMLVKRAATRREAMEHIEVFLTCLLRIIQLDKKDTVRSRKVNGAKGVPGQSSASHPTTHGYSGGVLSGRPEESSRKRLGSGGEEQTSSSSPKLQPCYTQEDFELLLSQLTGDYRSEVMLFRCYDWKNWAAASWLHRTRGEMVEAVDCKVKAVIACSSEKWPDKMKSSTDDGRSREWSSVTTSSPSRESFGSPPTGLKTASKQQEAAALCKDTVRRELERIFDEDIIKMDSPEVHSTLLGLFICWWMALNLGGEELTQLLLAPQHFSVTVPLLAEVLYVEQDPADSDPSDNLLHIRKWKVFQRCRTFLLPSEVYLHSLEHHLVARQNEENFTQDVDQTISRVWEIVKRNLYESSRQKASLELPRTHPPTSMTSPTPGMATASESTEVVVFSCRHSIPRPVLIDSLVPLFQQRMATANTARLFHFSRLLADEYRKKIVGAACPICVYKTVSGGSELLGKPINEGWISSDLLF